MNHSWKIAFFGSDKIALPCLQSIIDANQGWNICAVLTQPDRRTGRGRKFQPNPIKSWALEHELPIHDPEKPGLDDSNWIKEIGADLILVMAYGHILSSDLLTSAPRGCFNLHASLLPFYRGASPIETSLAMGDKITGVTLMEVSKRMDAGPIIDKEEVEISKSDTGVSLRNKISKACVPLISRTLPTLLDGDFQKVEQDDQLATYCRKLSKEDGRMNFLLPAAEIESRTRAFAGWPGSYFEYEETILKVGKLRVVSSPALLSPGERHAEFGNSLVIATPDGAVEIMEVQKPGGKMLPVSDFLRGFPLPPKITFSSPAKQTSLLR